MLVYIILYSLIIPRRGLSFYVYNVAGEKRIAYTSKSVHAITSGGKYGNPKKVNAKKSLKLKKGKKKKISAKLICKKKPRRIFLSLDMNHQMLKLLL